MRQLVGKKMREQQQQNTTKVLVNISLTSEFPWKTPTAVQQLGQKEENSRAEIRNSTSPTAPYSRRASSTSLGL